MSKVQLDILGPFPKSLLGKSIFTMAGTYWTVLHDLTQGVSVGQMWRISVIPSE